MSSLMMKLMGRVLMNEAPADGAPSGGAAPATPAAAPAAAPAAESTLLTPPATPAATDPKPEGEQPAKPGDPAKPEDGKPKDEGKKDEPQGAPEAYTDFKLPEGMDMDAEVLGEFKGLAKELNISQEKAQQLIDFQTKLATKQAEEYQAAVTKQGEQWAAAVKSDPELGGENYDKSVASAVKVIQAFGDDGLKELLNTSGLGNHPALFKFCHRVSQAISEDKFVMPGSQTNTGRKSNEDVFYGQGES
ncbi:peptidase [Pseudomonas mandelii]|uniref:Peptidase n=1 Tax=Pseudomonas mandelii TaxID=75612 RepID=A0AB36CRG3_9PSED|nr:peptidase [Pseudomonas mandelii]NMZ78407.1 peptidase [Pseudomonas mandelii]